MVRQCNDPRCLEGNTSIIECRAFQEFLNEVSLFGIEDIYNENVKYMEANGFGYGGIEQYLSGGSTFKVNNERIGNNNRYAIHNVLYLNGKREELHANLCIIDNNENKIYLVELTENLFNTSLSPREETYLWTLSVKSILEVIKGYYTRVLLTTAGRFKNNDAKKFHQLFVAYFLMHCATKKPVDIYKSFVRRMNKYMEPYIIE